MTSGKAAAHNADIEDIRCRANTYKQTVIAQCAITDARKELGRTPIRPQRRERWPPDAAGQYEVGHIVVAQQGEAGGRGPDAAPGMGHVVHGSRFR